MKNCCHLHCYQLPSLGRDTKLGFPEFVLFVIVLKKMEIKYKENRDLFPAVELIKGARDKEKIKDRQESKIWEDSMAQLDAEAVTEAWEPILHYLDSSREGKNIEERAAALFDKIDSDHEQSIDLEEFNEGLKFMGVIVNHRQVQGIMDSIDTSKNGRISLDEFMWQMKQQREAAERKKEAKDVEDATKILGRAAAKRNKTILEFLGDASLAPPRTFARDEMTLDREDRTLGEVVEICARRVACRATNDGGSESGSIAEANVVSVTKALVKSMLSELKGTKKRSNSSTSSSSTSSKSASSSQQTSGRRANRSRSSQLATTEIELI